MTTVKLSKAQANILTIVIEQTLKTRGKNKGEVKDVISSDSFDHRSFIPLIDKGLVTRYHGVLGYGFVATEKALTIKLSK